MKKIFSSILCASLLLASGVAALAGGVVTNELGEQIYFNGSKVGAKYVIASNDKLNEDIVKSLQSYLER